MPALSPIVVEEFRKLCEWTREAWFTHRTSFEDNPHIESILNIGANAAFLARLSIITQEYALLQLAKLHDPAVQAGQLNLTIEYIVNYGGWDPPTLSTLQNLKSQLDELHAKIKPARNKNICHNDLMSLLSDSVLGGGVRDADLEYFRALEEFVSIVHEKTVGSAYEFGHFAEHDARVFMDVLPRDNKI